MDFIEGIDITVLLASCPTAALPFFRMLKYWETGSACPLKSMEIYAWEIKAAAGWHACRPYRVCMGRIYHAVAAGTV